MDVLGCWRYPVKSMQGLSVDALELGASGVVGDRVWAVVDAISGRLASAKRHARLLHASIDGDDAVLPDGRRIRIADDPESDRALSEWLGGEFRFEAVAPTTAVSYEMTFEPTDDDAEVFEIPAPVGTFLDLAPVHIVTAGTLAACASARPDLAWDIRRFRPNLVIDTGGSEPFAEQAWIGMQIRVGEAVLAVTQPTVRCAVPLRAQPGLKAQPELFRAMSELNTEFPNHLGLYASVAEAGTVWVGDRVEVLG